MDIIDGAGTEDEGERAVATGECGREPHRSGSLRTFGAFLQALREFHGLSRAELAALIQ